MVVVMSVAMAMAMAVMVTILVSMAMMRGVHRPGMFRRIGNRLHLGEGHAGRQGGGDDGGDGERDQLHGCSLLMRTGDAAL